MVFEFGEEELGRLVDLDDNAAVQKTVERQKLTRWTKKRKKHRRKRSRLKKRFTLDGNYVVVFYEVSEIYLIEALLEERVELRSAIRELRS